MRTSSPAWSASTSTIERTSGRARPPGPTAACALSAPLFSPILPPPPPPQGKAVEGGVKRRLVLGSTGIRITAAVRARGGGGGAGASSAAAAARSGKAEAARPRPQGTGGGARGRPTGPARSEASLPRPTAARRRTLVPHPGRAARVRPPLAASGPPGPRRGPCGLCRRLLPRSPRGRPTDRRPQPSAKPRESSGGAPAARAGLVPRGPRGGARPSDAWRSQSEPPSLAPRRRSLGRNGPAKAARRGGAEGPAPRRTPGVEGPRAVAQAPESCEQPGTVVEIGLDRPDCTEGSLALLPRWHLPDAGPQPFLLLPAYRGRASPTLAALGR